MSRHSHLFSAHRALRDPYFRVMLIVSGVLFLVVTTYFLVRVIPASRQSDLVILHYSPYLGIDDARRWPWLFIVPGIAFVLLLFDTMAALLLFQRDQLAARAILGVQVVAMLLWSVGTYLLTRINL